MRLFKCRQDKKDDWVDITSNSPEEAAEIFVEEYIGMDCVYVHVRNHGTYRVSEEIEYSYFAKKNK